MKALLKSFWFDIDPLPGDDYETDAMPCIGGWINFRVGSPGTLGADDFRVFVCTPGWICKNLELKPHIWGLHILIIQEFSEKIIESALRDAIDREDAKSWLEIAGKLAKLAHWEFDGYLGSNENSTQDNHK